MSALPVAVVAIPFALAISTLLLPSKAGRVLTAAGGLSSAGCILAIVARAAAGAPGPDALSALFLLPVAIVYGTAGLYCTWYVRAESIGADGNETYRREFLVLTNAFACAQTVVPLLTNMAGMWVALEATTILAALLVRLHGTDAALEAAWKYILIASCGLAVGLVGVVVLYASGTGAFGAHYVPSWKAYVLAAERLNPDALRLAFVLALIGFGTKMGLAPMHTWLPDAHGAGPTPTSAMLSGILLSDALYVIARFAAIANAALGTGMTERLLFVVGLLSLFAGAFFVLRQSDLKRLLAYSSIEHMGIVACGLAFGVRLAVMGAFLHVVNHAATKSLAFFGAGRLANRFDSREIGRISGAVAVLPVSGSLFAFAALALAGMPPFGLFRSELMILTGAFGAGAWMLALVVLGLLVVAFTGLVRWATAMTAGDAPAGVRRGERDAGALASMLIGFAVVLGLGLYVPPALSALLEQASTIFMGRA